MDDCDHLINDYFNLSRSPEPIVELSDSSHVAQRIDESRRVGAPARDDSDD